MNRRRFVLTSLAGVLPAPPVAEPQQAGKVYRIGFLSNSSSASGEALASAFRQGLSDLGWVDRQNVSIEYRWADGDLGRHPRLTAELVARKVDVLVLSGVVAARAALQATRTIPIVEAAVGDPVERGLALSLAKPGRNLTGLAWQSGDLVTKQLQLLREALPRATRMVALRHAVGTPSRMVLQGAARSLGVNLDVIDVGVPADIPGAFGSARRARAEALVVVPSPLFYSERRRLTELATLHRLPAIYEVKAFVDEGGLASYGPSFPEMFRRAATYVDKLLRGANPADLPMEQPTTFELVINLKTAKALGLTMPPSLLARADQVLE
jgi:putative ABC transport system substrate-binding protein